MPSATGRATIAPAARHRVATQVRAWSRSVTLPLASADCPHCYGLGLAWGRLDSEEPCKCVLRAIFRQCHAAWLDACERTQVSASKVSWDETNRSRSRNFMWSRKNEEFCADFICIARRTLTPPEGRLFELHFIRGFGRQTCITRLGIKKGTFHSMIYRIQERLGRAFYETMPYALYPIDEYFAPGQQRAVVSDSPPQAGVLGWKRGAR